MYLDNSEGPGSSTHSDVLRICFKYWREAEPHRLLAAEGEQTIAFLYSCTPNTWVRGDLPEALKAALIPYGLSAV